MISLDCLVITPLPATFGSDYYSTRTVKCAASFLTQWLPVRCLPPNCHLFDHLSWNCELKASGFGSCIGSSSSLSSCWYRWLSRQLHSSCQHLGVGFPCQRSSYCSKLKEWNWQPLVIFFTFDSSWLWTLDFCCRLRAGSTCCFASFRSWPRPQALRHTCLGTRKLGCFWRGRHAFSEAYFCWRPFPSEGPLHRFGSVFLYFRWCHWFRWGSLSTNSPVFYAHLTCDRFVSFLECLKWSCALSCIAGTSTSRCCFESCLRLADCFS